jgi:hypothetical protein
MFITIDSSAGSTTAAPRPWMPRMMIRKVSLAASAQASEAAVKSARPAMNRRLRPSRSAGRPPSSRNPPKVSAQAVITHCRSASGKCSPRPMVGRATLTIIRSMTVIRDAVASSAKAHQRRTTLCTTSPPVADMCHQPLWLTSFWRFKVVMFVAGPVW